MKTVNDIRQEFVEKYKNRDFTIDKTGVKTVEIVGDNFIADEDTIFCKLNKEYVQNELSWYLSQSRNVYDIPGKIPAIWKQIADKDGFIHSNYGWCVFSEENSSQYRNCLRQLLYDQDTRRAVMIYTRPSMQYEYDKNGNCIYCKNANGFEYWKEYDENGNMIHYKHSNGDERWFDYDENNHCIGIRCN